uniref:Phospholipase A2-like central domain-containing protein n=1 Tax=Podarcis muralis TaxID=64176 RepID=A0A670IQL0_PODMU
MWHFYTLDSTGWLTSKWQFCGLGGLPRRPQNRCCQIHNECYGAAQNVLEPYLFLHSPYVEIYSYTCFGANIACASDNSSCQTLTCHCERAAMMCFSGAHYIEKHKNLGKKKYCQ